MPSYNWLTPKILEIRFDDTYELCNSSYLFSHHYEDPHWNGKVFTRLELDEFYERNYDDAHHWKKKWSGSNIPDYVFERFIMGDFVGLNDFELDLIQRVRGVSQPYYVIMTSNSAKYTWNHEIAHAIWYTNSEYKRKAQEIVEQNRNLGYLDRAITCLREQGYADHVLNDELHVYCGVFYDVYFARVNILVPSDMRKQLIELFNEYRP